MLKKPIIYLLAALLTSCASNADRADRLLLFNAIEESAQKIAAELPEGSRIAIAAFGSDNLSDFITKQLTGVLAGKGIEVADMQNLDFIKRELNFHSGSADDERAVSIGRFLGAQPVVTVQPQRMHSPPTGIFHSALGFITGQQRNMGGAHIYEISTIHTGVARRTSVTQITVNNGQQLTRMPGTRVMRTVPKSAGEYLDRGILFLERGDFYLAIMDFNEAILHDPNFTAAFQWRGTMHLDKGSLDYAIADFTQVILLDPNFAEAYNNRGIAHRMKGNLDYAIVDFNQAIRLNPNFALALHGRGNTYFDRGNYESAIADYNLAIRLKPNFALAFNNRGVAHRRTGNLDSAMADFNRAIRLEPNLTEAHRNRSDALRIRGNFTGAIASLNQAIRFDPNLAQAYNSRGIIHLETGNYNHAIADFETTLRLEPDNNNVRLWLEEARRRRDLYETAN